MAWLIVAVLVLIVIGGWITAAVVALDREQAMRDEIEAATREINSERRASIVAGAFGQRKH